MTGLGEFVDELVADTDAVFLFSPGTSRYEAFVADTDVVVVGPDNDVDAESFVELPLEFDDITERVRFGVEGAVDSGYIGEEAELVCVAGVFSGGIDTVTRVRAD